MEWISVKERLPNQHEEVLTFSDIGFCTAEWNWYSDDKFQEPYFMCKDDFQVKPTHWMPLPEPPKEN